MFRTTSSGRVPATDNVSHVTVLKILRGKFLHPYDLHRVQTVPEAGFSPRETGSRLQQKCVQNQHFLSDILFTNKAMVTKNVVLHNDHALAEENPVQFSSV